MPARTKPATPRALLNDIARLKQRVSWLEAALRPKAGKEPLDRGRAHSALETAASKARRDALSEYYEGLRERRLRESPLDLKIALDGERKVNAFLRSKGLRPEPSSIPKHLRRRR